MMRADPQEVVALGAALERSDAATQKFLRPLLPLRGVRELLLSFVRDGSRPFEDWVWDPRVRQVLENMRAGEGGAPAGDVDRWYEQAASEQLAAMHMGEADEQRAAEMLRRVEAAQRDGKDKFKHSNFYAARNAFLRSLAALQEHQLEEYYGKSVDAAEWEPDMQAKYVTLCNNVAVCGIKEKDVPVIREYANKALVVDPTSSKAMYALAKMHLMEHLYEDALRVLDQARKHDPGNRQWDALRREIDAAEAKYARDQAELAEIKRKKDEELAAAQAAVDPKAVEERERAYQEKLRLEAQQVPLPTREDDAFAAKRLHTYFMKIKQKLLVEIKQLHDSDKGESPLFACTVANGSTGDMLASDVRGSSKKSVKNEACKLAIKTLWDQKEAAGTLVAADLEYLAQLRRLETGAAFVHGDGGIDKPTPSSVGDVGSDWSYPIRLSISERVLDPVQLMMQLTQQGKLRVTFDVEDVSPHGDSPLFQCTAVLNGETVGVAQAPAKKKARAMAAEKAQAAAFKKNLIMVWDPPELRGGDSEDTSAP